MDCTQFIRLLNNDALVDKMLSGDLNLMDHAEFASTYFPAETLLQSWTYFEAWSEMHEDVVQWELIEADPTAVSGEVLMAFALVR